MSDTKSATPITDAASLSLASILNSTASRMAYFVPSEVARGLELEMNKRGKAMNSLGAYLRQRAAMADKSSREWNKANGKAQAGYRAGMWYAYHDIENFIGTTPSKKQLKKKGKK